MWGGNKNNPPPPLPHTHTQFGKIGDKSRFKKKCFLVKTGFCQPQCQGQKLEAACRESGTCYIRKGDHLIAATDLERARREQTTKNKKEKEEKKRNKGKNKERKPLTKRLRSL